MTRDEALIKIEELKKFVNETDKKEEKIVGIAIKTVLGTVLFQSTKTTIKEAVIDAKNNGANLSEADLRGADLSEANLSGANLYGANLSGANLSEANLYGANLSGANLSEANLSGANLSEAELMNAKFKGKTMSPQILKQKQVPDFLLALGFKIED